jgi:hypothetical protein
VIEVRVTDSDREPASSFFSSRPITVTIEFELTAIDPSFTLGFDLGSADGVVVFRSYITDTAEESAPRLSPGRNAVSCTIPPGLLNSGRYAVHLRVGLHWVKWIVHLDDALQFDVVADHGASLFLNDTARPGVVAPILAWEAVAPSEPEMSKSRATAPAS